jgi:hypothetical protein
MKKLACLVLLLAGCAGTTPTSVKSVPEPTYDFGGGKLKLSELIKLLNGNLVLVQDLRARGDDSTQLLTELFAGMLLNGLDFTKLALYKPQYDAGSYSLTQNGTGLGFKLRYAKDFGDKKAGDLIPYNVFDPASFVTNPRVDVSLSGLTAAYDQGPLFGLVQGDVAIAANLAVTCKVDASYLAFEVSSANTYGGQSPRNSDTFAFSMTTTSTSVPSFSDQLKGGGFGLLLDGSVYTSKFFGMKQTFTNSPLLIKQDDQGAYWGGTYQAKVEKGDFTYEEKGTISSRDPNTTDYYTDDTLKTKIGTARHATNLKGGSFTFANGTVLPYDLVKF